MYCLSENGGNSKKESLEIFANEIQKIFLGKDLIGKSFLGA